MLNKLSVHDWLFWSLFTIVICIFSLIIFRYTDTATWNYYGEAAFIIYLIVVAGWSRAFRSLASISLICILIYLIIMVLESPEYKSGSKAFENGDYKTAVEKLEIVIDNDPEHYDAAYLLCIAQAKLGHYKEAIPYCNHAIKLGYPLENESYSARARVYRKLNRPKQALNDFTQSLKSFNSWYVLWERCRVYNQLKRYDDAITDCQAALALNKDFYDVWWPLGNAFYQKKDYRNAYTAYKNYQQKADKIPVFMQQRIIEMSGQ